MNQERTRTFLLRALEDWEAMRLKMPAITGVGTGSLVAAVLVLAARTEALEAAVTIRFPIAGKGI